MSNRSILSHLLQHNRDLGGVHQSFLAGRREGIAQLSQILLHEINPAAFPVMARPEGRPALYNEKAIEDFASADIGPVLGQEYAPIDAYKRRVRLPLEPYRFVSRVIDISATRGEFKPCKIVTEYDIPADAWYAADGRIPVSVAVEAGQGNLFMISYLGIDLENKGEYVYRLLDCTFTILDSLPPVGSTVQYEVEFNDFVRHGNNLIFFFSFTGFLNGKPFLRMDRCTAGFFSDQDLAVSKGVIRSNEELAERGRVQKVIFQAPLACQKTSFEAADLAFITAGTPENCFGPAYAQQGKNPLLRFPAPAYLMVDRITSVNTQGGLWGLGEIFAEKNLLAEEWYFQCHFKDDEILPGTLMAEGCVQLLEFYALYLGLHNGAQNARFQMRANTSNVVRCKGQVTPGNKTMKYRLEVTNVTVGPIPSIQANVDIILDDKVINDFQNICVELVEDVPTGSVPVPAATKQAQYTEAMVDAFATGDITQAFGPEFAIYNIGGRRPPRTPNGHLQLLTRVLWSKGQWQDFEAETPHELLAEYDVPAEPWFCRENSHQAYTPYSAIMEIALQPNGFQTASLGSTLLFPDVDLFFRNLDGEGELIRELDLRGKTIQIKSQLLSTAAMNESVIQKFTFELSVEGEVFYVGTSVFGYFTVEALSDQVGMDKGDKMPAWFRSENIGADRIQNINLKSTDARNHYYKAPTNKPYYRLADSMLDFIEDVTLVVDGGKFNKGYIHSTKKVDATDWFYPDHFHQDPVMPGSLGVEAMFQSLQVYVLNQDLGKDFQNPRFGLVPGKAKWVYRGQIIPTNQDMTLEVHIKEIRRVEGRLEILADGNLWKEGLRIYSVENIGLSIQEG